MSVFFIFLNCMQRPMQTSQRRLAADAQSFIKLEPVASSGCGVSNRSEYQLLFGSSVGESWGERAFPLQSCDRPGTHHRAFGVTRGRRLSANVEPRARLAQKAAGRLLRACGDSPSLGECPPQRSCGNSGSDPSGTPLCFHFRVLRNWRAVRWSRASCSSPSWPTPWSRRATRARCRSVTWTTAFFRCCAPPLRHEESFMRSSAAAPRPAGTWHSSFHSEYLHIQNRLVTRLCEVHRARKAP